MIHESTTSGPWPWTPLTRESIEALEAAEREAVGRAASPATIGAMRRRWKIGFDLAFVRGYHAARARLGGAARGD